MQHESYGPKNYPFVTVTYYESDSRATMVGDILYRHKDNSLYHVLGLGYEKVEWGDRNLKPYHEREDFIDNN